MRGSSTPHRPVLYAVLAATAALGLPAPARAAFVSEPPAPSGSAPFAVESADFDADGRPDLAVANNGEGTVSILRRQAGGGFALEGGPISTTGSPLSGPRSIAVADFNGDTRRDLAVLNSTASVTVLLRKPDNTGFTAEGPPFGVFTNSQQIVSADFNGDGKPDLATASTANAVQVFMRVGGGFTEEPGRSPIHTAPGTTPKALTAADFNADSRPDLAVVQSDADNVAILLRQPLATGGFLAEAGSPPPVGDNPQAIAAGDFSGDGRPDLVVPAANAARQTTVLVRQPAGGFAAAGGVPVAQAYPTDIVTADFNADGRLDYAISEPDTGKVEVLLKQSTGAFGPDPTSPVPANATPQSVAVADFDSNNLPDLAVANNAGGTVTVLRNVTPVSVPDTAIDEGPSGATRDSTPTFRFRSSSAGASFECRLDGAAFAACTSPLTTGSLADGPHVFEVRAKTGPTVDPTPAARSFIVDTSPPDTLIATGPSGATTDSQPSFTFASTEGGSSFECRVDGNGFQPCSSPFQAPALTLGPHTFEVRATDSAGNLDETPAARSFEVVEPPVARFTVSPNPTCVGSTTRFDASASTGSGPPLTRYRFEYSEQRLTTSGGRTTAQVVIADGTSAFATHIFDWNINYLGGTSRGSGNADRVTAAGSTTARRDDADVTLTVTDASGTTATTTQQVRFAQHLPGSRVGCPALASDAFDPARPLRSGTFTSTSVSTVIRCTGALACGMTLSYDVARTGLRAAGRRVRRVVIAKGRALVPGGERRTVQARLTAAGRRLLRGRRRLTARVKVTTLSPTGKRVTRTGNVKLKVKRRR